MDRSTCRTLLLLIACGPVASAQTVIGAAAGDQTGRAVACLGDVSGDLVPDYAVGSPGVSSGAGRVRMYRGGSIATVLWTYGGVAGEGTGAALARLPDIDGDGKDDLLAGGPDYASDAGSLKILSGATGAILTNLLMGTAGLRFGQAVANAGDVDGDGDVDFLVGVPGASSSLGRVELWSTNGGLMRVHSGTYAGGNFGSAIAGGTDFTGDGRPDYAIGAPSADVGGLTNNGRATVYNGATGALLSSDQGAADHTYYGSALAITTGWNGNRSQRVLLAGAPHPGSFSITGPVGVGDGYVRIATLSAAGAQNIADINGSGTAGERFGTSLAGMDFDGDGLEEFCIGASETGPPLGSPVGPGYVAVYDPVAFSFLGAVLRQRFDGVASGDGFGHAIAAGRDVDGDAFPDILAGAPFADPNGASSGRASFVHPLGPPASPVVISEVFTGEPDGVEIRNLLSSSISIAGWKLQWKDGSGTHTSQSLAGSLAAGGVRIVLEIGAAQPAETPAVIPVVNAFPALGASTGPVTVTLFAANGLPVDEVRLGSPNLGSLGGNFRGLVPLPAGATEFHAERIWGLDSDSGADWTAGGARTFGLANGCGGARGTDPEPVAAVVLNEIDVDDGCVEIMNLGAATADVRRWSVLGSAGPGEPYLELGAFNASSIPIPGNGFAVAAVLFFSPPEMPAGTLLSAQGPAFATEPWGTLPYTILLRDAYGRTVDLVRATGAGTEAVHHHPKAPAAWDAFLGVAERIPLYGNSIIARVPGAPVTGTGADWRNAVIRTMGSANTGLVGGPGFASTPDLLVSEGTDFVPEGPGDGLAVVINAGAAHAGEKWSFFVSFVPTYGSGPWFGLGTDAIANWLFLSTVPPWFGFLDASGHARLDIAPGTLPAGIHTEDIFILQDGAGLVTGYTKVVYHDT